MKIAVADSQGREFPVFNLGLAILMAGLLIWFVLWANYLGYASYQEGVFETRLSILVGENNFLRAEKSAAVNLGALLRFARRAGLAEQKSVEYVFDEKGLAQAENTLR